jgi:hypothetical protein
MTDIISLWGSISIKKLKNRSDSSFFSVFCSTFASEIQEDAPNRKAGGFNNARNGQ